MSSACRPIELPKQCNGENISYYSDQPYEPLSLLAIELVFEILEKSSDCWNTIQPVVCSMMFPKCETVDGVDRLLLPTRGMCEDSVKACGAFYNSSSYPEFLKCDEKFPSECDNETHELATRNRLTEGRVYIKFLEELKCNALLKTEFGRTLFEIAKKLVQLTWSIFTLMVVNALTLLMNLMNVNRNFTIFFCAFCCIFSCLGWFALIFSDFTYAVICQFWNEILFASVVYYLSPGVKILCAFWLFLIICKLLKNSFGNLESLQEYYIKQFISSYTFDCGVLFIISLLFIELFNAIRTTNLSNDDFVTDRKFYLLSGGLIIGFAKGYMILEGIKKLAANTIETVDMLVVRRIIFMKKISLILTLESCVVWCAVILTDAFVPKSFDGKLSGLEM